MALHCVGQHISYTMQSDVRTPLVALLDLLRLSEARYLVCYPLRRFLDTLVICHDTTLCTNVGGLYARSKQAASQFMDKPNIIIDKIDVIIPNDKASDGCTLPEGIGRFFVLSINKSISLSYH